MRGFPVTLAVILLGLAAAPVAAGERGAAPSALRDRVISAATGTAGGMVFATASSVREHWNIAPTGARREREAAKMVGSAGRTGGAGVSPKARPVAGDLAAPPVPYTAFLRREKDRVRLGGHLPSGESRADLLEAAGEILPGIELRDMTVLAEGAPAAFADAVRAGFGALALVDRGMVEFHGREVTFSGLARHFDTGDAVRTALAGSLPAGYRLKSLAIAPPRVVPYYFMAIREPGEIRLGGFYPDERTHQALLIEVAKISGDAVVSDHMHAGSGAPENYVEAVAAALGLLSMLPQCRVSLFGLELEISGTVFDEADLDDFRDVLSAVRMEGKLTAIRERVGIGDEPDEE